MQRSKFTPRRSQALRSRSNWELLCHWAMADPAVVSPAIARSIAEISFFMARNIALACSSRKANVLACPEPVDPKACIAILRCLANEISLRLLRCEHEKTGSGRRPVGVRTHLEKNRRTRRLARDDPWQDA